MTVLRWGDPETRPQRVRDHFNDRFPAAETFSPKTPEHGCWPAYVVGIDSRLAAQKVLVVARDFDLVIYGQTGLLRQYLPRYVSFRDFSQDDLDVIAAEHNGRPRQSPYGQSGIRTS